MLSPYRVGIKCGVNINRCGSQETFLGYLSHPKNNDKNLFKRYKRTEKEILAMGY